MKTTINACYAIIEPGIPKLNTWRRYLLSISELPQRLNLGIILGSLIAQQDVWIHDKPQKGTSQRGYSFLFFLLGVLLLLIARDGTQAAFYVSRS